MATFKIKVSDKIVDKVLWLLGHFSQKELGIVESDLPFDLHKSYLEAHMKRHETGESKVFSVEEAEERLERIIKKHES